jgi:tetratricopeptide (TPR) repeat protein
MVNLGALLSAQSRYDESEAVLREVLAKATPALGPDDDVVLTTLNNLGFLLRRQQKLAEARSVLETALASRRRIFGEQHPYTLAAMTNVAAVLSAEGRLEESEALQRRIVETKLAVLGPEHAETLKSMSQLGVVLCRQGKPEGERVFATILEAAARPTYQGLPIDAFRGRYGDCLTAFGRYAEAEPVLLESYAQLKAKLGVQDVRTQDVLTGIVALYEKWGKPKQAAAYVLERR